MAHPDPLASPERLVLFLSSITVRILNRPSQILWRELHYARQSAFEGSRRQKRSWIVRRVLAADAEGGVAVRAVSLELDRAEREAGREAVDEGLFSSILDDLVSQLSDATGMSCVRANAFCYNVFACKGVAGV